MDERREMDVKKYGFIFFCLAIFYLTFLFALQMAFTGDVVWFDGKISVVFAVLLFTLSPMASREMFPTLLGASWRPIVGYAIGFALYVCLNLSICPWQLCDETVVDSVYITGTVLYDTGFYVAAWHLGLWGTQAKYTILKWLCYLSAAIVCVFGLWHTLMHGIFGFHDVSCGISTCPTDAFSKETLIKSLSYFAISIIMQDKEKGDANSEAI